MSNEEVIKAAHIWAVALVLAGVILGLQMSDIGAHNYTQSNGNSNQSAGNSNRDARKMQNDNSNKMAGTLSSSDKKFVMDAAMGGMLEVELGKLAVQRATSDAVKQFGQRMVDDHSKANTELMTLAQSKGVTLPGELDQKQRSEIDKLTRMSGADFDRAYSKKMLSDHIKDVSMFERQSTRGADADLRAFAAKTLPTLKEHLQMVKTLPGNEGSN